VPNLLAQRVEETLRPVIGTVLAAVSVDVESKRIGKTPETLERADLEPIANNLVSALRLVVGQEMADAAARKVRELT
jgi:ribosomal protein L12E/L44/L45/RPP1/RPP2